MSQPTTLYDKIWNDHLVHEADDGTCLLYIDRHLVHEVTSPQAFEGLRATKRKVHAPEKTLAVVDHNIPTTDRSKPNPDPESIEQMRVMEANAKEFGIEYFNEFDKRQGIVHVIGPEQGFTLPGTTIVCGDSHTSTHGAFGALAHGIGTSEVEHVLATQTLIQKKAKNMRVSVDGKLPDGVTGKDIILAIIGEIGTAGGTGYVLEYAGDAIRALSMEGRMTVCNMSIEGGARAGLIAPDEKAFEFLKGRPKSPKGADWDAAMRYWDTLRSDQARISTTTETGCRQAAADRDLGHLARGRGLDRRPGAGSRQDRRRSQAAVEASRAEIYGPDGGDEDHRHQARPRLHRLLHQRPHRGSARRRQGRRRQDRHAHVNAMIVPGSGIVKEQAEAEGLDKIFIAAGFEWREPGCSMCLAMNPDKLAPEERCASTSNRNFEGRQGFKGRTHLVSPAMAAAAAIAGHFVDIRDWH